MNNFKNRTKYNNWNSKIWKNLKYEQIQNFKQDFNKIWTLNKFEIQTHLKSEQIWKSKNWNPSKIWKYLNFQKIIKNLMKKNKTRKKT
jgi:hypothetical protein